MLVCAQHSELGLMRGRCAPAHQRCHDARDDLACDACGVIPHGGLLKPILQVATVSTFVRIDGRRYLIVRSDCRRLPRRVPTVPEGSGMSGAAPRPVARPGAGGRADQEAARSCPARSRGEP